MVAQINDKPETITQQTTDEKIVYELGKYIFINLKSKGMNEDEALKVLNTTEPYHKYIKYILDNLNREGLVNINE